MTSLLKRGPRRALVREFQRLLNSQILILTALIVDGDFGPATLRGFRTFQSVIGLVVNGIVGPQAMVTLKQATTPAKPGRAEPEKLAINMKRIYRDLSLQLRNKTPKRRVNAKLREDRAAAVGPKVSGRRTSSTINSPQERKPVC
jgi:peptidoglycan hydrolase-like protein with peptidoglycan-binding domain